MTRQFNSLEAIEGFAIDQDRGAVLEILSPVDGSAIGWQWVIAGPDSDTQARARMALIDELAAVADFDGRVTAAARETARLNNLARCVLNWSVPKGGEAIPFSHANVVRVLRAGQWLQSQVDGFAGDRRRKWGAGLGTV